MINKYMNYEWMGEMLSPKAIIGINDIDHFVDEAVVVQSRSNLVKIRGFSAYS